jgi:cytoskeleton-associated protein 5
MSHDFLWLDLMLSSLVDIKGFLTDVKPALLSALDTEYEKNPFEVCCVW